MIDFCSLFFSNNSKSLIVCLSVSNFILDCLRREVWHHAKNAAVEYSQKVQAIS
jgi:hypothetical protein